MPSRDVLEEVQSLKGSARANTTFGEYEEALADLKQAIDYIKSALGETEEQEISKEGYSRYKLMRQLADCYGMAGGVYRRKAKFDRANLHASIKMYDTGRTLEINGPFDIQNSYNTTNAIVVRLIQNANSLNTQRTKIWEAIETIQKQVEVKRRNEWWAWADLGLLYLLVGKDKEALQAYEQFKITGARAGDYESTLNVLNELKEALSTTYPRIADSIARIIQYLEKSKPSR